MALTYTRAGTIAYEVGSETGFGTRVTKFGPNIFPHAYHEDLVSDDNPEGWGYPSHSALTNPLQYSEKQNTAPWVKTGAVTATENNSEAPDGSNTACRIANVAGSGANDLSQSLANGTFTNDAAIHPSFWMKAVTTSGVLRIENPSGAANGQWDIDLSAIPSTWFLVHADSAYVTVNTAFTATAAGAGGVLFYRASGGAALSWDMWGSQQVEKSVWPGVYIPTVNASVTSSAPSCTEAVTDSKYLRQRGEFYTSSVPTYSQQPANGHIWDCSYGGPASQLCELALYRNTSEQLKVSLRDISGAEVVAYSWAGWTKARHYMFLKYNGSRQVGAGTWSYLWFDGAGPLGYVGSEFLRTQPVSNVYLGHDRSTSGHFDGIIEEATARVTNVYRAVTSGRVKDDTLTNVAAGDDVTKEHAAERSQDDTLINVATGDNATINMAFSRSQDDALSGLTETFDVELTITRNDTATATDGVTKEHAAERAKDDGATVTDGVTKEHAAERSQDDTLINVATGDNATINMAFSRSQDDTLINVATGDNATRTHHAVRTKFDDPTATDTKTKVVTYVREEDDTLSGLVEAVDDPHWLGPKIRLAKDEEAFANDGK